AAGNFLFSMPSYDDVLLVVKSANTLSSDTANYFKAARLIPDANVCTITVNGTTGTVISKAIRDQMALDIKNYLINNNLQSKINYIILSAGFPVMAWDDTAATKKSLVDVYIMHYLGDNYPSSWVDNNPYAFIRKDQYNDRTNIKFSHNKYGYYILSRLDGPSISAIKKTIDGFGASAYESYKSGVKYVLDTTYMYSGFKYPELQTELESRGVTWLHYLTNNGIIHDISGINFLDANWVNDTTGAYARGCEISWYPHHFKHLSFNPGSAMMVYRSFPTGAGRFAAMEQGLYYFQGGTHASMMKTDGTDYEMLNMSDVEINQDNNTLWCALGQRSEHQLVSSGSHTTVEVESRNGNGIAVYGKSGTLLARYTEENTGGGLLCNAVYEIKYDSYNKRMWVGTFEGVCYYDIQGGAWHTPSGLSHPNGARVREFYIDPTTAGKYIYVTYARGRTSGRVPNALANWTRVFEYNIQTDTVTIKNFGISSYFYAASIVKTQTNVFWMRYMTNNCQSYIVKIINNSIVNTVNLANIGGKSYVPIAPLDYNRQNLIYASYGGVTNIFVPIGTTNASADIKVGVLRIKDDGTSITANVWGSSLWYDSTNYIYTGDRIHQNPFAPEKIYLSTRDYMDFESRTRGKVIEFSETGTAGISLATGDTLRGINDIVFDNETTGKLWIARYQNFHVAQHFIYEFFPYGLCGAGGGLSHDTYYYDNDLLSGSASSGDMISTSYVDYYLYSGGLSAPSAPYQMRGLALRLLDGYYFAEARFGSMPAYPAQGGLGHIGHMLVMDPKSAPYAPRVDFTAINYNISFDSITGEYTLKAKIFTPVLGSAKNTFLAATINSTTVSLRNESQTLITPYSITYSSSLNEITYKTKNAIGNGEKYYLSLKCGINGIKNSMGASLINTRPDEFSDEIILEYTAPSADITAPIVSGAPNSFTAYAPFNINLLVNENYGYWKTNSGAFVQFSTSGTVIPIGRTTTLYYYGKDAAGNTSATNTRVYTLEIAPQITLVSPSEGSSFREDSAIIVSANASDSDGTVSKVQFYANNVLIGEKIQTPYSIDWTNHAPGIYYVKARATDNAGLFSETSAVTVEIKSLLDSALVDEWRFDEGSGTVAIDSASNNNGTISGAVYTSAKDNTGLLFDGIDDKVDFNTNLGIKKALSAGAWVKPDKAPEGLGRMIAATYAYNSDSTLRRGWYLGNLYGSNDSIAFGVYTTNGTYSITTLSGFFSNNKNRWVHVTGVFTPGESVALYTNGVLAASSATVITEIAYNDTIKLRIGARADNTTQARWSGLIDEVTVYDGALPQTEIAQLVEQAPNVLPEITITSPADGSSFREDAVITLEVQANDSDDAVSKVEFYINGQYLTEDAAAPYSITWSDHSAGIYSVQAKVYDTRGANASSSAISVECSSLLETALVYKWNFDEPEGAAVIDSKSGLNGTLNGAVRQVVGKNGKAVYFDAANDNILFSGNAEITGTLTVAAWVNPDLAPSGTGRIVANTYYYSADGSRGWYLGNTYGSNDTFAFGILDQNGTLVSASITNFFADHKNKWVHVAGIFKPGSSVCLYTNGMLAAQKTTAITQIAYEPAIYFKIGARAQNNTQGLWSGLIDEVRIFDGALEPNHLAALVTETGPLFIGETGMI
ncbi:MAG TPA: hypothetical protein DC049_15820, partial [Spirochaetia bacterium]|nr:hypothetical protein [Spirochaetia bacterium]